MTHLVPVDDLHRVDLGEGEWIDIKREFDSDDWIRFESLVQNSLRADGTLNISIFKSAKAMLTVAIKAWHLMENDQPFELTPENIGRLRKETTLKVAGEINRLNPMRTEVEQKKSSRASTPPSRRARRTRKN